MHFIFNSDLRRKTVFHLNLLKNFHHQRVVLTGFYHILIANGSFTSIPIIMLLTRAILNLYAEYAAGRHLSLLH